MRVFTRFCGDSREIVKNVREEKKEEEKIKKKMRK